MGRQPYVLIALLFIFFTCNLRFVEGREDEKGMLDIHIYIYFKLEKGI